MGETTHLALSPGILSIAAGLRVPRYVSLQGTPSTTMGLAVGSLWCLRTAIWGVVTRRHLFPVHDRQSRSEGMADVTVATYMCIRAGLVAARVLLPATLDSVFSYRYNLQLSLPRALEGLGLPKGHAPSSFLPSVPVPLKLAGAFPVPVEPGPGILAHLLRSCCQAC